MSTVSAIDLAGSEDNRRTENGKERMVESASINKSLFVLAQCVEAISKKQNRIPYRESKMTRILSLGQNNGLTVMILNLAPVRSYHLDTVSSLNFANRTKKIEVREVENDPIFKCPTKPVASVVGSSMQRQPLRPLAAVNVNLGTPAADADADAEKPVEGKPVKAFSVYSDKPQGKASTLPKKTEGAKRLSPLKRRSEALTSSRPSKSSRPAETSSTSQKNYQDMSAAKIEEMVEKKVEAILAARAANEPTESEHRVADDRSDKLNQEVQRRLELLEQRMGGKEDARTEGLSYLLMAKQHHSRGEDASALKMYQLALPFFPSNEKLIGKILKLGEKLNKKEAQDLNAMVDTRPLTAKEERPSRKARLDNSEKEDENRNLERDEQFSDEECDFVDGFRLKHKPKKSTTPLAPRDAANTSRSRRKPSASLHHIEEKVAFDEGHNNDGNTPRTSHLLRIINTRDVSQIKLLKGVGAKKAEAIVDCMCEMDDENGNYQDGENGYVTGSFVQVKSLSELGRLRGVGLRTVENMRGGVEV